MPEDKKWRLHIGCHRGTLISRDSHVLDHDSLEDCKRHVQEAEAFYRSIGYYVWYAYAVSPDGKKIQLHAGTSYF